MKGIIPGVGALITWTIIPGTRVHFSWLVFILVHESILVVIPMGGHLGYNPNTGGQIFLFNYWRTMILGTRVQIFLVGYYPSRGGHFDCYPYRRSSWLLS
jgi:hypothetical protein